MSRRDDRVSLAQMLDHALEAIQMTRGRSRVDLDHDRMLELALTRLIEILGEAAHRVSDPYRESHPEIPWSAIIGARNRLIHGYDHVDLDILWDIIDRDLPPLAQRLELLLRA